MKCKASKIISVISVFCLLLVVAFSNASIANAENTKGDPAIYPNLIFTNPVSFPYILKGTEGKFEYEIPRAKGYEDIEIKGTARFKTDESNSNVLKLDEDGKYKAIGEGKAVITWDLIISDETQKEFKEKYGVELMILEIAVLQDVYVVDGEKSNTVYRLYNPNSGEHFYSSTQSEIDKIVAAGWKNEGIAWTAPAISNTPVYRLYNPNAGDHHYTMSADEKDYLVKVGWNYEGIGWYSDDAKGVELYRLYNPNAVAGSHHYTVSESEKETLVKAGWKDEAIAWYGR